MSTPRKANTKAAKQAPVAQPPSDITAALTDRDLDKLIAAALRERERRQLERERSADLERRRDAIRAGKGDPGPATLSR
jgi:hypothetical protein